MTRRQLLTSLAALPVAPALAVTIKKNELFGKLIYPNKLAVAVVFDSETEVLFDMEYFFGEKATPWKLVGRSFVGAQGREYSCVSAKYGVPVEFVAKDVARKAKSAMHSYCVRGKNTYNPEGKACFVWA